MNILEIGCVQEYLQHHPKLESYPYDNYLNSIIYHHAADVSTRMDFVSESEKTPIQKNDFLI